MPIGVAAATLIGGAITGGAGLAASRSNRKAQAQQNADDRHHEIVMQSNQNTNERAQWRRENEYNHPAQQMERLRQAGLNPNLVYGKGADNTASSLNLSQANPSSKPPPQHDIMPAMDSMKNSLMQYAQIRQINAQTDNLGEQNALIEKERLLKEAQTLKTVEDTKLTGEQAFQLNAIRDNVITKARLENEQSDLNQNKTIAETINLQKTGNKIDSEINQTNANTRFTLNQQELNNLKNSRDQQSQVQAIIQAKIDQAKSREEIRNLQQMRKNAFRSGELQAIEIKLRELGLNPNDPSYWQLFFRYLAQ